MVCYLDRTSLAFAALQLCNEDWFNAKVYGLVRACIEILAIMYQALWTLHHSP